MSELEELYQEIVMEHNRQPRTNRLLPEQRPVAGWT